MRRADISNAKDPDLRSSPAAMLRASALARKVAMDAGTDLVIVKDGRLFFMQLKTESDRLPVRDERAK